MIKNYFLLVILLFCIGIGCAETSGSADKESSSIKKKRQSIVVVVEPERATQSIEIQGQLESINLQIENPVGGLFGLDLSNNKENILVGFNANDKSYYINSKKLLSKNHQTLLSKEMTKDEGVLNIKVTMTEDLIKLVADGGETVIQLPIPNSLKFNHIQLVGNINKGSVIAYSIQVLQ